MYELLVYSNIQDFLQLSLFQPTTQKVYSNLSNVIQYPIKAHISNNNLPELSYYENGFSMVSSGGIFVPKVNELKLFHLGLPKWKISYIDFAPEACRINLARTLILSYNILEKERFNIWKSIESKVYDSAKEISQKENRKSFIDGTELISLVYSLPPEGESLSKIIIDDFFEIILTKFTKKDELYIWLGDFPNFLEECKDKVLIHLATNRNFTLHLEADKIRDEKEVVYILNTNIKFYNKISGFDILEYRNSDFEAHNRYRFPNHMKNKELNKLQTKLDDISNNIKELKTNFFNNFLSQNFAKNTWQKIKNNEIYSLFNSIIKAENSAHEIFIQYKDFEKTLKD